MNSTQLILGSVGMVSLVSFVGVLGISFSETLLRRILTFLIPLAVGALLGDAFFHLIPESFESIESTTRISLLMVFGTLSFFYLEKFLRWHRHSTSDAFSVADSDAKNSKHLGQLILVSDSLHNFFDGIIIAVGYLVSVEVGLATTLAVILHEIPQEIGDFGVLIYSGYKRKTALFYNFLSALTALAGALVVLLLGSLPEELIQGIIPFAAGTFIYIASSDLVPELHKNHENKDLIPETVGLGLGILVMYGLLFLE